MSKIKDLVLLPNHGSQKSKTWFCDLTMVLKNQRPGFLTEPWFSKLKKRKITDQKPINSPPVLS
jgi:hypothetical protein